MASVLNGADSAAPQEPLEVVFVYGSLKRGLANHQHMAGAVFVGPAQLQGLALYDLGPFPMAIASGDPAHTLFGEVFGVDTAHLAALDRFEGAPRLYERHSRLLADQCRVWVYLGRAQQVRHVSRISSGIWSGPLAASQRHQPTPPHRESQRQG